MISQKKKIMIQNLIKPIDTKIVRAPLVCICVLWRDFSSKKIMIQNLIKPIDKKIARAPLPSNVWRLEELRASGM